ncbi:uncharacterized protein [Nicotiana tomentosiformis]|uniref:uncharacterized protein n=1 Tax=Nicotiana tomentosiformis TaxID=4098 RepID=UPI00388C4700
MTVTQYETRFVDLAHHATILLPTEKERVRRFIDGITCTISLQMAKKTRSDISFQTTIDISRRIELVRAQERGSVSDKSPRHYGSFSGASSGGKGAFGRAHPPMPFHSALQASHSSLGSCGPYVPYSWQPAYSAPSEPISAPPIQSYHCSYPTRLGQIQFQQPQQQDRCFECGGIGHIRRSCSRLLGGLPHQSSCAMVLAPVAPPLAQPARGGGQAIKGRGQAVRGGSQPAKGCPRDVVQSDGPQPRCYAFPARPEAESSDAIITELAAIVHALKIWRHNLYSMSCQEFTDHRSLQYLFKQKDLNLRQKRCLELLKDYNITILYHPGKANVVAGALSRKAVSMGSLTYIPVGERLLATDVQALANQFLRLDVSERSHILACTVARSSLYECIRERQYDDPYLLVLKDMVQHGDAKQVTVGDDGFFRMQGHICVPNLDGLLIVDKA